MKQPVIIDMLPGHLPEVLAIEQASSPSPWSLALFEQSLQAGETCRVMVLDERVAGFAIVALVVDQAHVHNIAIHPDYRRRHLGQSLLTHMLADARQRGAQEALLEVRVSNQAACRLYDAMGFIQVGRRKAYYQTPSGREDALLYTLAGEAWHGLGLSDAGQD